MVQGSGPKEKPPAPQRYVGQIDAGLEVFSYKIFLQKTSSGKIARITPRP